MADQDRYGRDRDRYRDERGFVERAGDEVRSWFGDDEAGRRRRLDEQERGRERERWGSGSSRWGDERSYSSDRDYGDGDYGWRGRPDRDWSTRSDRDWSTGPRQAGTGINWERQSSRPEYRNDEYSRSEYSRPEYNEFSRQSYGGPYGSERFGSREWSSSERWRAPGPYVGKGPRGYQRSDERIREEINDRLTAHGWIDASDVECRVQNGEVTLTGHVDSREAKRTAEDIAEAIPGVREVNNQLRVRHLDQGVGRTSVLGISEPQGQSPSQGTTDTGRSRTR
jgi:osmotically-inducible protein OsmY